MPSPPAWSRDPRPWLLGLVAALLGPVPVFQVLHAESSAVVSAAAFFVCGLVALRRFKGGSPLRAELVRSLAALLAPLAVLTASLLWAPNRGYPLGLLLFVTMAVPSGVLAVVLAWGLAGWDRLRRKRLAFVGIGLAIALGGVVYDLGFHPQFYTYSHVFGGVLGPIYDEELNVRAGFFAFRGITLGWALLALLAGRCVRGDRASARPAGLVMLALAGAYALSGRLGFTTSHADLARSLGGHVQTPHFDLYFDPSRLPRQDAARLALEHEYRYAWLADTLGTAPAQRIRSYLYPDAATKGRLTGARVTSVAPVWLAHPQTHIAAEHFDRVFGHELVHAFSRDFGLPLVKASRRIGLVEGLAVAFEPPDALPPPHDQVSSQMTARGDTLLGHRLAATLGAGGFWTGRGAVSYTTTGSFVGWLAHAHGAERVRRVYAWGDFEAVFGQDVEALGARWEAFLRDSLKVVSAGAGPVAAARFSVPSLFEKPSPHYVPRHVRLTRQAAELLARADTSGSDAERTQARTHLDHVLRLDSTYAPALDLWARLTLPERPDEVIARLERARLPALTLRLADAYAAAGHPDAALARYDTLRRRVAPYDHDGALHLWLRTVLARSPEHVAGLYLRRPTADTSAAGRALNAALSAYHGVPDAWPAFPRALAGRFEATRAAWRAEAAWQAGTFDAAEQYAGDAAAGYAALGDRDAAAFWRDRRRLAAFARAESPRVRL